jgi:RNA polymerase sigma factor (sigma-70 family)
MRSVQFSDAELLRGLIQQDEKILKAYYRYYFQGIQKYVIANNGSAEDARDLFQDVLMVLFQKVRDGKFTLTSALGTYLFSVGRLLWLKELSKRKFIAYQPVDTDSYVDIDADIEQVNDKNERLVSFRKCFDRMSENCRKVLTLFTEGFSIAEITRIMGFKTEQHTKNRRYRCKLALIRTIKEEYEIKQ